MSVLNETVRKELEDLFDNLKKASQKPENVKHESGDNTPVNTLDELFTNFHKKLDELLTSVPEGDDDLIKIIAMKSSLCYEDAKIRLGKEAFAECKSCLNAAIDLIKDYLENPFMVYLHLRIINHLSFAYAKLGDFSTAKDLLVNIVHKELSTDIAIYSTEELFAAANPRSPDAVAKLHSIRVNNFQMLSWVYSKMNMDKESALIQHKILELDLNYEECDAVDWAMRCTRVASLYLVRLQFVPARYYLSAAGSALDRVESAMIEHPEMGRAQAELARGWIYYGLRLFDTSKSQDISKLCNKIFDEEALENVNKVNKKNDSSEERLDENLKFTNSEVKIASVPAKFITTTSEAHALFQHTQVWLRRARVFYTLRDYPFVYVNCVLDLSELYRFLAFFEPDLDTQYNVQKRRADALETLSTILKEVRPQCYVAVSVELLRELAEVQIELMGINLKRMYKMHDVVENQDSIRRRMEGVYDVQKKLEKIGNMFEHSNNIDETTSGSPSGTDLDVSDGSPKNEIQVDENQVDAL